MLTKLKKIKNFKNWFGNLYIYIYIISRNLRISFIVTMLLLSHISIAFLFIWSTLVHSVHFGPLWSNWYNSVHWVYLVYFSIFWSIESIPDLLGFKLIIFVGCLFSFGLKNSVFFLLILGLKSMKFYYIWAKKFK